MKSSCPQDALWRYKPQIVHFGGHGSPDGKLIFENQHGQPVAISSAALNILFSAMRGIRLVVMNACWSALHAKVLTKSVDCVVGMRHALSAPATIQFVAGFYRSLGEGSNVHQAFELGCAELEMAFSASGLSEKQIPQLRCRKGVEAKTVAL